VPPVEALAPQGDHSISGILCSLGPITFFAASTGMENAPNLMVDLEKCQVDDGNSTSGATMHKYAIMTVAVALLVSQVQALV
jgi:hypothetical protein